MSEQREDQYAVAEFTSLREELRDTMNRIYQITALNVAACGALFTASLQQAVNAEILWVVPVVSMALWVLRLKTQQDIEVIAAYLETCHEQPPGFPKWEKTVHKLRGNRGYRGIGTLIERVDFSVFAVPQLLAAVFYTLLSFDAKPTTAIVSSFVLLALFIGTVLAIRDSDPSKLRDEIIGFLEGGRESDEPEG